MATRTCVACGLTATKTSGHYSRRQWRKGVGRSRCLSCSNEDFEDATAIRDEDVPAHFSENALTAPFSEGGFRWVALGEYFGGGRRDGELCVAKWLKDEFAHSPSHYRGDMRCVRRTLDFVRAFNALNITDIPIRVFIPSVHRFGSDSPYPGMVYLREPYIEDYDKWNSNSGWYDNSTEWADVMQALSHFSYHASGGQHVLCDLQGGVTEHECTLTDPAILSRGEGYGSTDMNAQGISSFFYMHECNEFCDPEWILPDNTYPYIDNVMATTVLPPVDDDADSSSSNSDSSGSEAGNYDQQEYSDEKSSSSEDEYESSSEEEAEEQEDSEVESEKDTIPSGDQSENASENSEDEVESEAEAQEAEPEVAYDYQLRRYVYV